MPSTQSAWTLTALKDVIQRHWGYGEFRPFQEPAMQAVLDGRDSLLVLPTGGGKSLCYQAPAVLRGETTVVISPLISLMKDQVDSLQACGVPAIQLDSSLTASERNAYEQKLVRGEIRLLFVSPERLMIDDFCRLLKSIPVRTFAIDEAHCISHWGHDFRPEYRQLDRLKELFPGACVHAYTATATERVRGDIVSQLRLHNPEILVGSFDRPNLNYRILSRRHLKQQVIEALERHRGEAGIIYCIRRRDVDELAEALQHGGYKALPYHAGLTPEQRRDTQNAFRAESCDLVVATVAFGMGIDRSNVRFVLHTGMPKSIEHYQQETGRAGRDGLEAECVLLHSGQDFMTWKFILEKSAAESGADAAFLPSAMKHLNDLNRYCENSICRHRALVEYFGQPYAKDSCGACDICLGDAEPVADALVVAQKILSCVARVNERFGIGHVVSILRGENTEGVRKWGHDKLSTYGLLREHGKNDVRDWVYQLVGQGVLDTEDIQLESGARAAILRLNAQSWEVMKAQRAVRLIQPRRRLTDEKPARSRADAESWENVDRELFEALRELRKRLAEGRGVPPYVVFNDATLRELAQVRPSTLEKMRLVHGIGEARLHAFGSEVFAVIQTHCRERGLATDMPPQRKEPEHQPKAPAKINSTAAVGIELFRKGASIAEVVEQTGRAHKTVVEYLADYILLDKPATITRWVPDAVYQRVAAAARQVGTARLKPIYLALGEQVSYDDIRPVVAHLTALGQPR